MRTYKFTDYFENEVLRKRAYLKKEWCISVLETQFEVKSRSWEAEARISSGLQHGKLICNLR